MVEAPMTQESGRTLEEKVAAAQKGSIPAFRWLYENFKDEMFRTSLAICRSEFLAEEALQESFIRIYRKIHRLRNAKKFVPWLYRIVINTTYSTIKRHRNNWDELDGRQFEQNAVESDSSIWDSLAVALQKLPKGYRNVFILHFLQSLPHEQVAVILNISTGTSKSQYSRARQKLKTIMHSMGVTYETN